jgi:hypothetical protein
VRADPIPAGTVAALRIQEVSLSIKLDASVTSGWAET